MYNKILHLLLIIILFFNFGCVSAGKIIHEKIKPIFYPAAPDAPRLQFLTSFSSSRDLSGPPNVLKRFIVGDEAGVSPIVKPYGVAVFNRKIYICDTANNSIDILDLEKRKFEYFKPKEAFLLQDPINLSFDSNGDMYVADSRRGQVIIFDSGGDYLGAIGKASELKPTSILILDDKIYICDLKASRVKIFSKKDREYLSSIPREGAGKDAALFSPTNIAADKEGNLYVSDIGAFRVQKYGPGGEFLTSIGSQGDSPGQFARPKGISVDKEGRIYVVDAAFENIQLFDREGKLLLFFGEPGSLASLVLPAGLVIDYSLKDYFSPLVDPSFEVEYLLLATSQYGERKLTVFGFGHKRDEKS